MNVVLFNLILGASCVYAVTCGGWPERLAAFIFVGAAVTTYAFLYSYSFAAMGLEYLAIDLVVLATFIWLALVADRFWPMWVAAVQLVIVSIDAAIAYQPTTLPYVYYLVVTKLTYPMILFVAIGTLRHRRRLAAFGEDRDWSYP